MSHSILEYLDHILIEASFLYEESQNLPFDEFIIDDTLTRAFLRSLEIIGEASKNLPENFKVKHPEIEWKNMAGMRDKLIHSYFGVDYDIVWTVVQTKIPALKQQIETIIQDLEE
ncbi:MAG TPA: DUF86 domain-containing protein [Balneolaceae bacterium]|nr:DUF86 domain-containing protein [Balneolaceae bacterium]